MFIHYYNISVIIYCWFDRFYRWIRDCVYQYPADYFEGRVEFKLITNRSIG